VTLKMDTLLKEAKESIEAAQNYRSELQLRLHGLSQARTQVQGSSCQAREALRRHFLELQAAVTRLLSERLTTLLSEVDTIEAESVKPLDECQSLIEHGVSQADELLREGEAALHCVPGEDKLGTFNKKAMHIQLDSLPEVPALVDVPCVAAQVDNSLLVLLRDQVSRHGSIFSQPPVQIEELQERPGGIMVRWCKSCDSSPQVFHTCQFVHVTRSHHSSSLRWAQEFRHRDPSVYYIYFSNFQVQIFRYSPVLVLNLTTQWCPGTEGYVLSSRRNIALRHDSSQTKCQVLYSKAPTYYCGQTLTFKISAAGQMDRKDSLGVCVDNKKGEESLQRDQAVCVSSNGAVTVNGKEMTNHLPAITTGSSVTFDMEVVNLLPQSDGSGLKLRVTIGSGNREVVFDWLVDQATTDCLFFGCSFVHTGWKVLVF
uniref:Cytokine receptor-like factor 3 n=1 Tax=Cynoglossus semilaevis TaxID=244447 RepID=A0A3P8WZR8_CYNSE